MTNDELKLMQNYPLELKIKKTELRIREWVDFYGAENVYISFSGGKDSTVLLDIVRSMYPNIEAVFSDTGLEYPEIKEFVRSFENVVIVRPKMSFKQVLETEGYPIVSKLTARKIRDLQNPTDRNEASRRLYLTGEKQDGTQTKYFKLAKKWHKLIDAPFKVSEKCCNIMKKDPLKEYEKRTGKVPMMGTMADEGSSRQASYLKTGCNSFKNGKSQPMGFWLEQDVLEYIHTYKLPIASVYGEVIFENGKYKTTGEKRTGYCVAV